jgi:hypothetical protein
MYLEYSRNQQSVYKGSLPSCSDSSSSNSSWLSLAFLLSSAWPLTVALQPLRHLVWRLEEVNKSFNVIPIVFSDRVGEGAVIEVIVSSFMAREPADEAVDILAEFVAAE